MAERGPGEVRVRPAGEEDIPEAGALFELLDRFQSEWRVFTARPTLRKEAEARYRAALEDPDALLIVAEEDSGRLVGMAFGRVEPISSISDERVLDVSNVVVVPTRRRGGVARRLLAFAAEFGRERGALRASVKTYADNTAAMAFWRSVGFAPRWVQMTASIDELRAGAK
ncbi:MAG TPA: GNAT family N-acetyltransferase [Actinomycetota bacterium]